MMEGPSYDIEAAKLWKAVDELVGGGDAAGLFAPLDAMIERTVRFRLRGRKGRDEEHYALKETLYTFLLDEGGLLAVFLHHEFSGAEEFHRYLSITIRNRLHDIVDGRDPETRARIRQMKTLLRRPPFRKVAAAGARTAYVLDSLTNESIVPIAFDQVLERTAEIVHRPCAAPSSSDRARPFPKKEMKALLEEILGSAGGPVIGSDLFEVVKGKIGHVTPVVFSCLDDHDRQEPAHAAGVDLMLGGDHLRIARRILAGLNARQRVVAFLYFARGEERLGVERIAGRLGVSKTTIGADKMRVEKVFREVFEESGVEYEEARAILEYVFAALRTLAVEPGQEGHGSP